MKRRKSGQRAIGIALLLFSFMFMPLILPPHTHIVRADPLDTWWDSSWGYRKSFNVTGQSTTETYYQVLIIVHRSTGSDNGNDVYVGTKCEDDYDDIRFTNDEEPPEGCNYWIEFSNSTLAVIWVELDSITADETDTFYIYYGNSGASSSSSGLYTFYHYDDFDTDVYTKTGTGVDIDEGGDERVEWWTASSYGDAEHGISTIPTDEWAFDCHFQFSSMAGFPAARFFLVDSSQTTWGWGAGTDGAGFQVAYNNGFTSYVVEDGVADTATDDGWSLSTTYYARVTYDGSTVNASLYTNYWQTLAYSAELTSVSFTDNPDTIIFQSRDRTGGIGWADDFRIRKYIGDDPQPANWGSEEESNHVPVNESLTVENADDVDYFYAKYRTYEVTVNATDEDGYAEIDTIVLNFSTYWGITYDEDDNSFTENDGSGYIDESGSTYQKGGTYVNVTFKFIIDWDHPDVTDIDFTVVTTDARLDSDTDTYDEDINVETRLDGSITLSDGAGTADRGNYDTVGSITASGTVYYYGGGGDDYPASNQVDAWVSCGDVAGSPWSDLTISSGAYSMAVDSDDVVGEDTYTLKVVVESAGSGGTDLLESSKTDTYIADRLTIFFSNHTDTSPDGAKPRVDVASYAQLRWMVKYDYDGNNVTTGTMSFQGNTLSWDAGNEWWEHNYSPGTVGLYSCYPNSLVSDTHGVNAWNSTSQTEFTIDYIADQIYVLDWGVEGGDWRVNYNVAGSTITVFFKVMYDYDDTLVTDGRINVDNGMASAQYNGTPGFFSFSGQYSNYHVADWCGYVDAIDMGWYPYFNEFLIYTCVEGDTDIYTNELICVWDELDVYWAEMDDGRVNTNENIQYRFKVRLRYDNHEVGVGDSVWLNDVAASWSGTYWYYSFTRDTVGTYGVSVSNANEVTYGIHSNFKYGAETLTGIYDELVVTINRPTYWKYPNGENCSGVTVTATYAYDGTAYDGAFTLNDTNFAHSNGYYGYTCTAGVGDDTYGITIVQSCEDMQLLWQTVTFNDPLVIQWLMITGQHWWAQVHVLDITWSIEGTAVPDYCVIYIYKNSTFADTKLTVLGDCFDLMVEFTSGWIAVNWKLELDYCAGNYYFDNWEFYSEADEVPVEHTLNVEFWSFTEGDDYLYVTYLTNWANTTISYYHNGTFTGEKFDEGTDLAFTKFILFGVHPIAFFLNGSDSDNPETDYFRWVNTSYTIDPFKFTIEWDESDEYLHVRGFPNVDCTVTIYQNESVKASGPCYTDGTAFRWIRNNDPGTFFVGVMANYSTYTIWRNFTYYNERSLAILASDFHLSDVFCNLYIVLNMNTSYFVYEQLTTETELTLAAYGVHAAIGGIISWGRDSRRGVDVLVYIIFQQSPNNRLWYNTSYSNAVQQKPEGNLDIYQIIVEGAPAWVPAAFVLFGLGYMYMLYRNDKLTKQVEQQKFLIPVMKRIQALEDKEKEK